MPESTPVRVKICGLTRVADAEVADRAGADYLGVVLSPGYGRSVSAEEADRILDGTRARRVAVLVDETPEEAARLATRMRADVLQLHGSEGRRAVEAVRSLGPWEVWKAVRARTPEDVERVVDGLGDMVDGVLVEGWREGVVGGGGVRLAIEPKVVRSLIPDPLLMILAGGLEPRTVKETMARYGPDVVDVSSGVEQALGIKDPELVDSFIQSVRT